MVRGAGSSTSEQFDANKPFLLLVGMIGKSSPETASKIPCRSAANSD